MLFFLWGVIPKEKREGEAPGEEEGLRFLSTADSGFPPVAPPVRSCISGSLKLIRPGNRRPA